MDYIVDIHWKANKDSGSTKVCPSFVKFTRNFFQIYFFDKRRNLFRENDRSIKGWRIRNQIIMKEKQNENKQDKKRVI